MTVGDVRLRWLSGPVGASWLSIAALIESSGSGIRIEVEPGGGLENLNALRRGECDLATSVGFLALAAFRGAEPYPADPFRTMRTLYFGWTEIPFHIIRAREVPAVDFATALRASAIHIGVPPRSTSNELTFQRVLRICGSSYTAIAAAGGSVRHANHDDLVELFVGGHVDYFFGAIAATAAVLERLGQSRTAVPIPAGPQLTDELLRLGYRRGQIEASTYPSMQSYNVPTSTMPSTLVSRSDLPSDIAMEIVGRLIDQADRVRAIHRSLANITWLSHSPTNGVPHHQGFKTDAVNHSLWRVDRDPTCRARPSITQNPRPEERRTGGHLGSRTTHRVSPC